MSILTLALIAAALPASAQPTCPTSSTQAPSIPTHIYHAVAAKAIPTACGTGARLAAAVPFQKGLFLVDCRVTDSEMAQLRAIQRASRCRAQRAARTAVLMYGRRRYALRA